MFDIKDIAEAVRAGVSDEHLYKKFGGFSIYIPKVMPGYEDRVIKEFTGYNHHVLATKYNVTVNQIYKIIRNSKPKQTKMDLA